MKTQSLCLALFLFVETIIVARAQYEYDDYGGNDQQNYYSQDGDTLYQDYAEQKQLKAAGGGG